MEALFEGQRDRHLDRHSARHSPERGTASREEGGSRPYDHARSDSLHTQVLPYGPGYMIDSSLILAIRSSARPVVVGRMEVYLASIVVAPFHC